MTVRDVSEAVTHAEEQGDNPDVAAFSAIADKELLHGAWLLSICLALSSEEFESALSSLWPAEDHAGTPERLRRWPFVEEAQGRMRIADDFAPVLMEMFRSHDPEIFRAGHELLASREEARELADSDPIDGWFIRGRVAFYLAGADPEGSAAAFRWSFSEAPSMDRTAARMWLTGLALRQASLLTHHGRDLAFYRGFRLYVGNRRSEALRDFSTVIEAGEPDDLSAIALHLVGVIQARRRPKESAQHIERSIELSADLGLTTNEVMARNSLAWSYIRGAGDDRTAFSMALDLAHVNLRRAGAVGDPGLVTWCSYTKLVAEWLLMRNDPNQEPDEGRAASLADELWQVFDDARKTGDPATAALAANSAVGIWRDLGAYERALGAAASAIDHLETAEVVLPEIGKLGQTVGSMMRNLPDAEMRSLAGKLLSRIRLLSVP